MDYGSLRQSWDKKALRRDHSIKRSFDLREREWLKKSEDRKRKLHINKQRERSASKASYWID